MQLKPKSGSPAARLTNASVARRRLMAASCALLSAGTARGQSSRIADAVNGLLQDWTVDSALAYYHENGRVQAIEPIVEVARSYANGQALSFNATFDALSGASPNGALTSHTAQTFASPSGTSLTGPRTYTTAPGQLPV